MGILVALTLTLFVLGLILLGVSAIGDWETLSGFALILMLGPSVLWAMAGLVFAVISLWSWALT